MRHGRRLLVGIEAILFVVVVLVFAQRLIPSRPLKAESVRGLSLTALNGTPISNSELEGKAVVLNFWAPWCPPCRLEIPWLQQLQNRDAGKLVVVGVVADESQYQRAAAFMKAQGVDYLLARDTDSLAKSFGDPSSLPTTYYISPSGNVLHRVTGVVPEYIMRRYAHDAISGN